jgi:hypothetical protein
MQYDKILGLALVPTIVFFLLSLVSLALTTHYWILGDWTIPRGVSVVTGFNEQTQTSTIDYTIVYFKDNETDATIASGCLCLSAAVMALIAWSTLRKPGMDTQFAAVCHGISHPHSLVLMAAVGQTSILGSCGRCNDCHRRCGCSCITCVALFRARQ